MKFAASSKFLKVTILYSCDKNGCLSISQHATGADPGQILSGFRFAEFRNFCPARGVRGMLSRKILKIKCLRLAEIGLPTTYFEDKILSFLIQSQIALAAGDVFQTYHTPIVLNFHCQRQFDDFLKIIVLGRFDRNYELTWIALELCIKTLYLLTERFELYDSNRTLRPLYISLLSDSLVEKFQTLTKY